MMTLQPVRVLLLPILLALTLTRGARGDDAVTALDLLNMQTVSGIDVSADGTKAVVAIRSVGVYQQKSEDGTPQGDPTYKNQSHLWLVDLADGAAPVQLTFGDRTDGSAKISPDGTQVAFVRGADRGPADGPDARAPRAQVWVLPLTGGEARMVTSLKHGAGAPEWSPDGRRLLVSSMIPMKDMKEPPIWPMERPGRTLGDTTLPEGRSPRPDGSPQELRAWLAKNAAAANPVVINRLAFQGEQRIRTTHRFRQLFVVDMTVAEPTTRRLTTQAYDHRDAVFSADGEHVIYVASKPVDTHPDRELDRAIWRIRLDGTRDEVLLDLEGWSLSSPRQHGAVLAFTGQMMDEPMYRQTQLGIASYSNDGVNEPVWLTDERTFDREVFSFAWRGSRSGGLVFNTASEGGFPLMTISPGLLEPATLVDRQDGLPVGVRTFDVGGDAIVYSLTSVDNPCTLRVRDARGDRLVMDLNAWTSDRRLSRPVERWITRPDGTRIQYWLMEPDHRIPGRQYPLAVEMHGGPSAMWGPGEASMWLEFQLLCSWGYGVVYCNPRGSGGYGYNFQKGNHQDWGTGPAGDVLAAVDHALLDDWPDDDRLVLTGGSYAGYLTAWIVSHDHRFRAAVAQRGVYDLNTFYGEGNAWRLVEWAMGGHPWQSDIRPILQRESPFTSVARIRTPLLIMHASNDLRTGVSQSEMMYRALKELGRAVEYVRYPNAGHDLSRSGDPLQRMDRLMRIIEFFERHI